MATIPEALQAAAQMLRAGEVAQAEHIYQQVLRADVTNADALYGLGSTCHQQGRLEEAVLYFEQTLCSRPRHAGAHHALGRVFEDQGHRDEAIRCYRQAARLAPDFFQAHFSLGLAWQAQGKARQAETAFRQAIRVRAEVAEPHRCLGMARQAQGDLAGALRCYQVAIRLEPKAADARMNLGDVLVRLGKDSEAAACFRDAIQLKPDASEAHYNLGTILQRLGQLQAAVECFVKTIRLKPDFALAHNNLGSILAQDGQSKQAAACLREAVRLSPDLSAAHNNLGTLLLEEGQQEEAEHHYREALRIDPNCISALASVAIQGVYALSDSEIGRIKSLLAGERLPLTEACQLHFALANLANRAGHFDEAFSHFQQGNSLRHRFLQQTGDAFDAEQHRVWVDRLLAACDDGYFRRIGGLGLETERPLFILGMPRSGTSLVEQILASHPQVFGGGELGEIGRLATSLPDRLGDARPFPDCLDRLDEPTIRAAAQQYLRHLAHRDAAATRVTDKMPSNFLYLGFIAALFPRARVIHCRRDPLDVCVSCYTQYFRGLNFTWDLNDLGQVYRQYERVMAHWRELLPLPVLEVVYEELVDNQEAISRRIVEFAGLEWDDRCLSFHENTRAVRTVSLMQVRQPLFRSGVGRWRRYAAHLRPLLKALGRSEELPVMPVAAAENAVLSCGASPTQV